MGKLFQRYKKNGKAKTEFKSVDSLHIENQKSTNDDIHDMSVPIVNNDVYVVNPNPEEAPTTSERNIPPTVSEHLTDILNKSKQDAIKRATEMPKKPNVPQNKKIEKTNTNTDKPKKEHYEVEAESLGFKDLPKNLANSLIAWKKSNRPVVNGKQWNDRLSICRNCSYWMENKNTNMAKCMKCGCSSGKLLLTSSSCPLSPPKWPSL
jgi:hypothetical protein